MTDKIDREGIYELIAEIHDACEDGEAVFRGEHKVFSPPAASAIYRNRENNSMFDRTRLQPGDVEKEIVQKARHEAFPPGTTIVEILTDLRHFGADTALVDFSKDMMVALFFACNHEAEEVGRVWVLPTKATKKLQELNLERIYEENREKDEMILITPGQTGLSRNRVGGQSSVFIHARQGFVDTSLMTPINVPLELKQDCIAYLEKYHNISQRTIYGDLIGFIQNEQNFKTAKLSFISGLCKAMDDNHDDAIEDFDEAIRLRHDFPEAFVNRAISKVETGDNKGAIEDFDEAIRLRPDYFHAFVYRGLFKAGSGDSAGAIKDCDEAIRLRPDDPDATKLRDMLKR